MKRVARCSISRATPRAATTRRHCRDGTSIAAWAPGFVGNTGIDIAPAPGEATATVDFHLERSQEITGRLLDGSGALLDRNGLACELDIRGCRADPRDRDDPEAEVTCGGRLEFDGTFFLDRAYGDCSWAALFAGPRPLAAAPTAGCDSVDFVVDRAAIEALVPRGVLAIGLSDEATGEWPNDCTLTLTTQQWSLAPAAIAGREAWRVTRVGDGCELRDLRNLRLPARNVSLAADGSLSLIELPAGRCWVEARVEGRASVFTDVAVIGAGAVEAAIASAVGLRFATAIGSVRGQVVAADGTPVERAAVRLVALDGARLAPEVGDLLSDGEGRFHFSAVGLGDAFVVVTPPDAAIGAVQLAPASGRVTVRAYSADSESVDAVESTESLVVTLSAAVRVRVVPRIVGRAAGGPWSFRVTDAAGARLRDDAERSFWREGYDGIGVLLLLTPGHATIDVLCRNAERATLEIVAERDTTIPIDVAPRR
ncbi:MAG: carboxypeptidase regulatory-like domain-containing protein [Planctomycetes bacterium]|nr:carboxypeptidase regulatory-like domain-containing protein [Planctomycetota bacterium]